MDGDQLRDLVAGLEVHGLASHTHLLTGERAAGDHPLPAAAHGAGPGLTGAGAACRLHRLQVLPAAGRERPADAEAGQP